MKKYFVAALFLLMTVTTMMAQEAMPPIPVDKDVRIGKLDNGLTYYIRHNEWPEKVANFYIAQRVDLDTAFGGAELRPLEHAHAQVDGGRVERIDVAVKLEDVGDPPPPRFVYHAVGEVLEDAEVPVLVGLGQVASCGLLPETESVTLLVMGFQRYDQVTQALAIGQSAKHQDEQLVPAREVLDILVAVVFADKVVEVIPIQKIC